MATDQNTAGCVLTDDDYQAFHDVPWNRASDFLNGVMYACGGPKKLERTGSQAEIILHSRIFYYQSTTGIAIPLIGYKRWLRAQSYERVKPWEWTILDMLCQKRDESLAKRFGNRADSQVGVQDTAKAQHEKDVWIHELYNGDLYDPAPHEIQAKEKMDGNDALQSEPEHDPSMSAPSWQTAAPKGELYVDRRSSANEESGKGQTGYAPYPVRFAQIIEAIQTGKPVEGIQEIPDTVARNPDTRPFGTMTAPKKPWEKNVKAAEKLEEPGYAVIENDFPDDGKSDTHD